MTTTRLDTGPGWEHPADCIPAMMVYAVQDAAHPDVLAWRARNVGTPATPMDAAARILHGIGRTISYVRDPPGRQDVRAPRLVIAAGKGDCKKMATVAAAAAFGLGIPFRFAVVAQNDPNNPNHTWAELWTGDRWTAVDPVVQPLALGRRVDGRIEEWHGVGQRGASPMQTATVRAQRTAIVRSNPRLAVVRVGLGIDASSAIDTAAAAMSAAGPYGAAAGAVLSVLNKVFGPLFKVKPYDAADDYPKDVARAKSITLPGDQKDRAANFAMILASGWVPIYCSDSQGTRDNIFREFTARGWSGGERWSNSHGATIGSKTWWYGVHFPIATFPAAVKAAAEARAATLPAGEALKRTMSLCIDAKHRMRSYGGTENYDEMLLDAFPVIPAVSADVRLPAPGPTPPGLPAGSRPVTPPAARAPTPPAARAPAAPARLPAGARQLTPPLPAGARLVSPPAAAAPAPAARPAGGGVWTPGGLTDAEASVIAALRMRGGTDIARRAARAAAAYGLGAAAVVHIVDAPTEAQIAATFGSKAVMLAKKDSTGKIVGDPKTRAAQVNYGLTHLGEGTMTRKAVAERLMAWKRVTDTTPLDSGFTEFERDALASDGGFPIGAVPTVAAIAAKLPGGPSQGLPVGSRQVTPPTATPPAATPPTPATPGAGPPGAGVAPLVPGAPSPAALPPGSTQIAPPTAPAAGSEGLLIGLAAGWVLRGRRAAA